MLARGVESGVLVIFLVSVTVLRITAFISTSQIRTGSSFLPILGRRQRYSATTMKDVFACEGEIGAKLQYFGYCKVPYEFYSKIPETSRVKQYSLVLIQGEGKILLGLKKRGFGVGKYNGFGGKLEAGESIEKSALREFQEETNVSLLDGSLTKRAILTFFFESEETVMQVHLFTGSVASLLGEPSESDEMVPQWFPLDSIPFHSMWADDELWFPAMLDGRNFEGVFLFRGQTEVVAHNIAYMPSPWPHFCVGDGRQLGEVHDLSTIARPDIVSARAFALQNGRGIVLEADRVVLVPYRSEHVQAYHRWMQDPELLQLTGSEPLTLEEEVAMQRSWAQDTDKATFIILESGTPDTPGTGAHGGRMVGDVNLFFYEADDPTHAEVSVMVAVQDARRRGLAREAVCAMLQHGYARLGARTFAAKIDEDNGASLALFESLGFGRESFSSAFRQHTLLWAPDPRQVAACLPRPPSVRTYD
jgi:RimJ/RimL family protein N-acetyltransferase/8-oxo-dGTP pyrophosphatase MutT (NUDIX family)